LDFKTYSTAILTRFSCSCGGTIVRWINRCPNATKLTCSTCGKETDRTVGELREALRTIGIRNMKAQFAKIMGR
jgi:hypothetical protein